MKLPTRNARLVFGITCITVLAAGAAIAVTELVAVRATFPQRPLLAAAIPFLERGADPALVLPRPSVDVESGGTWMAITDDSGALLASSARDGDLPVSLASCREASAPSRTCFFVPSDGPVSPHLTVQLPSGSRQAVVAAPWSGPQGSGYVFAGRAREELDAQWLMRMRCILAAWLAGMGMFAIVNRMFTRDGQKILS